MPSAKIIDGNAVSAALREGLAARVAIACPVCVAPQGVVVSTVNRLAEIWPATWST